MIKDVLKKHKTREYDSFAIIKASKFLHNYNLNAE